MAFANDFAQTLKQQADIVRIVGGYISLRKSGAQNYSGLCPFHKEKSPSFSVHAARQFYHCFGCQASGDVFSFVQKIENITFPEAVRAVAQKLGVPLPKQSFSTEAEAKDARLRTALLEIQERACVFFQECLRRPEGARAREYLAGRGLNEDTIRQFRIGFAPDSGFLLRDRLKSEFSEEVLRESGLFSWKDSSQPSALSPQLKTTSETNNVGTGVHARPTTEHVTKHANARLNTEHGGKGAPARPAEQGSAISAMYSKFRNRIMFPIAHESGRVIAYTGRTLPTDEKSGP